MKIFSSILFLLVSAATSAQQKDDFIIKGKSYLKEGIAVLNDYVNPDTAKIINGKFEFKGKAPKVTMISLTVPPSRNTRIIIEPGTITVDHQKDQYVLGGSPLNIRFQKIESELKPINDRITKFWSQYNKAEGEERVKIWREYDKAKKEKLARTKELVTADGTFAGFMQSIPAIHGNENATNIKHYLDIFKAFENTETYQSQLNYYRGMAKTDIGVQPPDWTLPDQNGKNITLSKLKGKYVLVDFWYSGCHWCRKMTPGLKNIYKELKGKGLEIVSVSVDPVKDEAKWRKAMEEDGAPWLQAWDAQKSLPEQYAVRGYPTMYFLGPDGKVLRRIYGYHDEPILREFFLEDMKITNTGTASNKSGK
jgi:peroxiredoxin